jgi:hypothetical protein
MSHQSSPSRSRHASSEAPEARETFGDGLPSALRLGDLDPEVFSHLDLSLPALLHIRMNHRRESRPWEESFDLHITIESSGLPEGYRGELTLLQLNA